MLRKKFSLSQAASADLFRADERHVCRFQMEH